MGGGRGRGRGHWGRRHERPRQYRNIIGMGIFCIVVGTIALVLYGMVKP